MTTTNTTLAAAVALLSLAPLSASAAVVETGASCKVAVMDFTSSSLQAGEEGLAAALTEALVGEVSAVSKCAVISRADVTSMMAYEADRAVCGDADASCLVEVAQAYGADLVVAAHIRRLGNEHVLTARLMNVKQGAVERRAERVVRGGPEELRVAAKELGRALFDAPPRAAQAPATLDEAWSPLLVGGAIAAGVGLALAAASGALAGFAEIRLGEAAARDKDGTRVLGVVALGAAGLGVVALAAGGTMAALAALE